MKDFNANDAREIIKKRHSEELNNIIKDIKSYSERGVTQLHVYCCLEKNTRQKLVNRGFELIDHGSLGV